MDPAKKSGIKPRKNLKVRLLHVSAGKPNGKGKGNGLRNGIETGKGNGDGNELEIQFRNLLKHRTEGDIILMKKRTRKEHL